MSKDPLIVELKASRVINKNDLITDLKRGGEQLNKTNLILNKQISKSTTLDLKRIYDLQNMTFELKSDSNPTRVKVSLSVDDKEWEEYKVVELSNKEIVTLSINSFLAGILKEGKLARYIKLEYELPNSSKFECKIYGESKI